MKMGANIIIYTLEGNMTRALYFRLLPETGRKPKCWPQARAPGLYKAGYSTSARDYH